MSSQNLKILIIGRKIEGYRSKWFSGNYNIESLIGIWENFGAKVERVGVKYTGGLENEDIIEFSKVKKKLNFNKYDLIFFTQLGYSQFFRDSNKAYFLPQIDYFDENYAGEGLKYQIKANIKKCIVGSRLQAGKYRELGIETHYIPYSLNISEISFADKINGWDKRDIDFMWIGRDDNFKGMDKLFKKIGEMRLYQKEDSRYNFKVKIKCIVEGEYSYNIVESLFKKAFNGCSYTDNYTDIEILREIERKEVLQLMTRSKYLLCTSVSEYLNMTVIEAGCMGCIPVFIETLNQVGNNKWYEEFIPYIRIVDQENHIRSVLELIYKNNSEGNWDFMSKRVRDHFHDLNNPILIHRSWRKFFGNLFRNSKDYFYYNEVI